MLLEERHKLRNAVGINLVGHNIRLPYSLSHGITFATGARCYHYLIENVGILCALVRYHCSYSSRSDNQNFAHLINVDKSLFFELK